MKKSQVTVYETADGKTFNDIDEARAHEASLNNAVLIDKFLVDIEATGLGATRIRNTVNKWEAYKAVHEAQGNLELVK